MANKNSPGKVVALQPCPEHRPQTELDLVQTGPGMAEGRKDQLESILLCWRCWEGDEDGMLRMMYALNFSSEDVVTTITQAFKKKPQEEAPHVPL